MSINKVVSDKIYIMKKFVIIFSILFFSSCCVFANTISSQQTAQTSPTTPQNVTFEHCTKMFPVNNEKLFYLTLGAISANKFSIEEIQTTNGYVIFKISGKRYLATISSIDKTNSILKITPCNNIYVFPPGVILNMFKYIDLNLNTEIK